MATAGSSGSTTSRSSRRDSRNRCARRSRRPPLRERDATDDAVLVLRAVLVRQVAAEPAARLAVATDDLPRELEPPVPVGDHLAEVPDLGVRAGCHFLLDLSRAPAL